MGTDAIALLISAISLALAGTSLGWQIAQWLLSGGRPKATLMHGMIHGAGAFVGPVQKDGKPFNLAGLHSQGFRGQEVVGVQVTNHGRAAVTVESVAVCPRGGSMRFVPVDQRIGPELPHQIEPGTNESWFVPVDVGTLLATTSREAAGEPVTGVYMVARIGTGKSVETPTTLRM